MLKRILTILDQRLVRPIRESHASAGELGLAAAIGLFWALTPLVGIQMILATFNWVIFRSLKIRFYLPVAIAWVWITNVFTMPFFYYAFYIAGYYFFHLIGAEITLISFATLKTTLDQTNNMNMINGVIHWMRFIVNDLGWPMVAGALLMGIPSALSGYYVTVRLVNNYRRRLGAREGMSLTEWEDKYVYKKELTPHGSTLTPENITDHDVRKAS